MDHDPEHLLNLLEMLSLDLRGDLRSALGKTEEAIALLEKAVDKEKDVGYGEPPQYGRPELESLGFAYIRAGKWAEARKAFQARAYTEFLAAWKNADPDLPMMEHAKSASR